jgi:2,4-dienoyl-CoA reductase-like NADH-dependent reductase (Old Yellow Enzyme family)
MAERLSSWDPKINQARGIPLKNLINVYKHWGEGGFGLTLTGNIMVAYDQLELPGIQLFQKTHHFQRFEAFKMGQQSKKHGSLVVGQVTQLVARRRSACSQILSSRAMSSWRVKCRA